MPQKITINEYLAKLMLNTSKTTSLIMLTVATLLLSGCVIHDNGNRHSTSPDHARHADSHQHDYHHDQNNDHHNSHDNDHHNYR